MKYLLVLMLFLISSSVSAMQSAIYVIDESILNAGGNTSTSATYDIVDSIGEPLIGQCNDEISILQSGYYNDFVVPLPTATPTATITSTPSPTQTPIRNFGEEILSKKWVYAAPNPIRGHTAHIYFHLSEAADVEIKVYTTSNQFVISKRWDMKPAGKNYWRWNVSNLANGVYIMLIKAKGNNGKTTIVKKKIALVK
ncbi:T9SS type A sorting domain-containing protein [bacterium]|nr:T9SS type A sorting domain-containing protein [bacterium]